MRIVKAVSNLKGIRGRSDYLRLSETKTGR